MIDPTARIEATAAIGLGVTVGPYCTIGPHVTVGDGCRLIAHVHLTGHTTIGARTVIHPFASLGSPPQSVHYRGGPTRLVVGADCDIREHVTMNTGTEDGGGVTQVGDRCFLMVGSHVGHDCHVGNNVVFANNILLAGHVTVGDHVVFGGGVAVRQFVRIGEGAMLVGLSGARDAREFSALPEIKPLALPPLEVGRVGGAVHREQHHLAPARGDEIRHRQGQAAAAANERKRAFFDRGRRGVHASSSASPRLAAIVSGRLPARMKSIIFVTWGSPS